MADPVFLRGLEQIHRRFDGLIVDQWGVLHDGSALFPEAKETLLRLRERGKRVVLLSNTGRRLAFNLERLRAMGLDDHLVDGVVTSGETVWQLLRSSQQPGARRNDGSTSREQAFGGVGRRCLLWSEDHDRTILEGLDLEPAESPEDAEFILLAGIPDGLRPDDLMPELRAAAARGLKMICCNPDRVVVVQSGVIPATGSVAKLYEDQGGVVHYVGKPYPPVYRACLEALRPISAERIVAIGDSLEHDIAGGANAGLSTVLVLGGIHAGEVGPDPRAPADPAAVARLIRRHGASPTFVLPHLTWTGCERSP